MNEAEVRSMLEKKDSVIISAHAREELVRALSDTLVFLVANGTKFDTIRVYVSAGKRVKKAKK